MLKNEELDQEISNLNFRIESLTYNCESINKQLQLTTYESNKYQKAYNDLKNTFDDKVVNEIETKVLAEIKERKTMNNFLLVVPTLLVMCAASLITTGILARDNLHDIEVFHKTLFSLIINSISDMLALIKHLFEISNGVWWKQGLLLLSIIGIIVIISKLINEYFPVIKLKTNEKKSKLKVGWEKRILNIITIVELLFLIIMVLMPNGILFGINRYCLYVCVLLIMTVFYLSKI